MTLIAYTDDPGLFLSCDGNDDFPGKDRLYYEKITKERITVLDHDAYNRWLAEGERVRANFRKPRRNSGGL